MKDHFQEQDPFIKQEPQEQHEDDYNYYDRDADQYYPRQVKRTRKVNWVLSQPRWVLFGDAS